MIPESLTENADFLQRWAETIAWCSAKVNVHDPKNCLRSLELRPLNSYFRNDPNGWFAKNGYVPGDETTIFRGDNDISSATTLCLQNAEQCKIAVDRLTRMRSQELSRLQVPITIGSEKFKSGRLLMYFADHSDSDGLSAYETSGFFDCDDNPPWDTWIDYVINPRSERHKNYLISWVPAEFCDLALEGLKVEATHCIQFADHIIWRDIFIPDWLSPFCQFSDSRWQARNCGAEFMTLFCQIANQ